MKKFLVGMCCLSMAMLYQGASHAATVNLGWDGSTGPSSLGLVPDDTGGDACNVFTFDGADHTSSTGLIVSDGSGIALGGCDNSSSDFAGNGIGAFGPLASLPNVDQVALQTDTPFSPVTMTANNTNLSVEQIVYVNNTKDYAIFELHAINQATAASPVFIGFINDWDIAFNSSTDGGSDFDAGRGLIIQMDDPAGPNHYSIGMESLNNPVDQFHLGFCCGLSEFTDNPGFADNYLLQRHFLNNTKPKEECDDGGDAPADGAGDTCSPKCKTAVAGQVCGNGNIEGDEECDDGGIVDGDGCDHRCLKENVACGNNVLDAGEECDDGNRTNGDGCDLDCKAEFETNDSNSFCGDGFVNNGATGFNADINESQDLESSLSVKFASVAPGEGATAAFCLIGSKGADMPTSVADLKTKADDCLAFYQQNIAVCGNGIQNAGEECDDGNTVDGDGCDSNCTLPSCGNGIVDQGETCDDGNTVSGDGCSATCQPDAICGNGVVDAGEQCDDGNTNNFDACSNACILNSGAKIQGSGCSLDPTEAVNASVWFSLLPLLGAGLVAVRRRFQ